MCYCTLPTKVGVFLPLPGGGVRWERTDCASCDRAVRHAVVSCRCAAGWYRPTTTHAPSYWMLGYQNSSLRLTLLYYIYSSYLFSFPSPPHCHVTSHVMSRDVDLVLELLGSTTWLLHWVEFPVLSGSGLSALITWRARCLCSAHVTRRASQYWSLVLVDFIISNIYPRVLVYNIVQLLYDLISGVSQCILTF